MTIIGRSPVRLVVAVIAATLLGVLWGYGISRTVPSSAAPATPQAGKSPDGTMPARNPDDAMPARTIAPNTPVTVPTVTSPTPTPARLGDVPASGSGRFAIAPGTGPRAGSSGRLVRYRVAVELESPVDPAGFAAAVERILAAGQGWTARGQWSFQRVDAQPADATVHLATPATTDRICGSHGLRTRGEVSCRGGSDIVINLKRWMIGVPWYADSLIDYQRMVVNHEVGHFLGRGHDQCKHPGALASVMQQQTKGLNGCRRNPWPYPSG